MNVSEILRNPIVKTVGIVVVLYFALFSNKENPESLGNRFSSKNIKEDFKEAAKKAQSITGGINSANEQNKEKLKNFENSAADYKDIKVGEGIEISCDDYAIISYKMLNAQNQELLVQTSEPITIGSQKNIVLEKNIIGMKRGGTRLITITENSNISDRMLKSQIEQSGGRLSFEVTLKNFDSIPDKSESCK